MNIYEKQTNEDRQKQLKRNTKRLCCWEKCYDWNSDHITESYFICRSGSNLHSISTTCIVSSGSWMLILLQSTVTLGFTSVSTLLDLGALTTFWTIVFFSSSFFSEPAFVREEEKSEEVGDLVDWVGFIANKPVDPSLDAFAVFVGKESEMEVPNGELVFCGEKSEVLGASEEVPSFCGLKDHEVSNASSRVQRAYWRDFSAFTMNTILVCRMRPNSETDFERHWRFV